MNLDWLVLKHEDLVTENRQLIEEGKDVSVINELYLKAISVTHPVSFQAVAGEFLDRAQELPVVQGYPYQEPQEWEDIMKELPSPNDKPFRGSQEELMDRVWGGWVGRCCGCLLGKPVEGWTRSRLRAYLEETSQYPLCYYVQAPERTGSSEIPKDSESVRFPEYGSGMPEDDDLNYTVIALVVYQERGPLFSSKDVAEVWLSRLPLLRTCTAERVAYRNIACGKLPPGSATYRNPYREWIGARIRADFWGYVNPCSPRRAASFAYRDACISHVKNGIYGAMATSAMVASAYDAQDPAQLIDVALKHIPERSRLAEALRRQQTYRRTLHHPHEAIQRIHESWDEMSPHHWCHVISNTEVVAMALLWGEGDFEKSVCLAVEAGMDTDCNGAAVGSILGVLLGHSRLPQKWTDAINDTLYTGVVGWECCRLRDLAWHTTKLAVSMG
ncbi:MAG: ADP-ribosylglycohydrolase family protein [Candidatus Caldarchaeum sp.]